MQWINPYWSVRMAMSLFMVLSWGAVSATTYPPNIKLGELELLSNPAAGTVLLRGKMNPPKELCGYDTCTVTGLSIRHNGYVPGIRVLPVINGQVYANGEGHIEIDPPVVLNSPSAFEWEIVATGEPVQSGELSDAFSNFVLEYARPTNSSISFIWVKGHVSLIPDIVANVPDWNLGELPRGESEKTFPEAANQLCFTYSGSTVYGKNFVINASNANGVVANRYQLKNVADATQLIPYGITLDSGNSRLSLPNVSTAALPFARSGKTCFVPTFKTSVDAKVKEGDYSDVLTFTVVIKP